MLNGPHPTTPCRVSGPQSGAKKKDKDNDKTMKSNCSSNRLRKDRGAPLSCCQDGDRMYLTLDGKKMGIRVFGTPCTEADGVGVNCEGGEEDPQTCAYGSCGARKELSPICSILVQTTPEFDTVGFV
jgi:hypothetical protein